MNDLIPITVCTQVYNSKYYLEKCISSVLNQSYTNFEYIIIDNGCTDGSQNILKKYAEKDSRIKLIRFEENKPGGRWISIAVKEGKGKYLANIDSDDWWELDYLQRMVHFLETNHLDLAVTGTWAYYEASRTSQIMRKLERPVMFTQRQFAQVYPQFWTFPSTLWASLMKIDVFKEADLDTILKGMYSYGLDTMCMLKVIEQCRKIGIDSSALQHYRIHSQGVSYQYEYKRFDSNIAYYEQIKSFLEKNQAFDSSKQEWLKRVHLSAINFTLSVLKNSKLSETEKLEECSRIISHPLTSIALTNHCDEREKWFANISGILQMAFSRKEQVDISSLKNALKILCPKCCNILQPENLTLFAKDAVLCEALLRDNYNKLYSLIMGMISQKKYSRQYDLGKMLHALLSPKSPLHKIEDTRFFREYEEECNLINSKKYLECLEKMTDNLLKTDKLYAKESYLDVYLILAALENHVPAFVFGKICLAGYYLLENRKEDCRTVLTELDEMGVESAEIEQLHKKLEI